MGKRKETNPDTGEEDRSGDPDGQSPLKKHKKHKHKKHKKKKTEIEESTEASTSKAMKVTVKVNDEEVDKGSTQSAASSHKSSNSQVGTSPKVSSSKKKKKGKDSGTSSEEERWLDAIESGKLEEVDDELKKIKHKDPKLMTARQRAMLERKTDKETGGEQLLALPTGYREKVMTPEMAQKAALKSQRRKQQADEKREKDKKKTMERLLRKQESKSGKQNSRSRGTKRQIPLVRYRNDLENISIDLPPGTPFPLESKIATDPPKPEICGLPNCTNLKRYSCSKTGVPLCSLACYKNNLGIHKIS